MILFSKECRFNLSHTDGRKTVYRPRAERFADACVTEWDRGGSVLVWGGIMGGKKTGLIVLNENINAQTYINDVLAVEALPFIQFHSPNVTFMHDNTRPHSAATTRQFLATNNVNVLAWPANSPDLNPIEQVWDKLECRVRRNHAIHTVNDLAAALQAEWTNLPAPFKYSVMLTVCAVMSQRALHKMVDTLNIDTFHRIFSLFLLVATPPNEFKPVLLCNCVLQN